MSHPVHHVVPMERAHAEQICSWLYEPPYNIYSWLKWEHMEELGVEFGDPGVRARQYVSVINEAGELTGFAQLFPMVGVTRLGIGMRPDCCGKGIGASFVQAIVKEAQRRYPDHEIDLEVLTWNTRAIRAYQKAGFVITDEYEQQTPEGLKSFYCMVYNKPKDANDN